MDYIQVFTTTDQREDAVKITTDVVEKRLAACAQILGPITSSYWWEGAVEKAEEWLCIIKSKKGLYENLEETIKALHPYDVPEILAVPVTSGNPDYLAWLDAEVGSKK
jgi:periplasmic divalent cation tolerance protein